MISAGLFPRDLVQNLGNVDVSHLFLAVIMLLSIQCILIYKCLLTLPQ